MTDLKLRQVNVCPVNYSGHSKANTTWVGDACFLDCILYTNKQNKKERILSSFLAKVIRYMHMYFYSPSNLCKRTNNRLLRSSLYV